MKHLRKTLALFCLVAVAVPMMAQTHQHTIYDSTIVRMEESGLSHIYHHVRVRMEDRTGCRDNGVVRADYDPQSAVVEIRDVRVHRKNGSTDRIDGKEYDYIAPSRRIYWRSSQKMVEVGHLEPGDELEYTTYKKGYTYALLVDEADDDKFIPPMRGHYYDIVPFWTSQPVDLRVYQLSILKSKDLHYQIYNDDTVASKRIDVQKKDNGDRWTYTFTKRDLQPFKSEQMMVAASDEMPKLLLSTAPDWQSKSRWFYGVNEDYGSFVATPELQQKVNELLRTAKTEFDSLNILTHWVADNMRYAGLTMGKGEGYTLHNAKMNFTDRCGVCKDKASLLIAMLRAAGFEAYAAMTMAGSRIDRIPADQFNHSVACVRLRNGRLQLIDPTWVPNVRELWSSAEQQQGYLVGMPDGIDLQETPVSAPENHYIRINGKSEITANGTLRGTFSITAEGQSDAAVRSVFSARQSEWQRNLEVELRRIAPQARIIEVRHTDNDRYLDQPVTISYKYEIPNYAVVTANELVFTPITARHLYRRAMGHLNFDEKIDNRQYAFRDRCSRLVQIEEVITLPQEYKQLHFQPVYGVANPAASFGCQYMFEGRQLHFAETVMMGKRIYEPEDWPFVQACVRYQKLLANNPVVLTK
ncbi:MAG: DUF3857 and transglutaminase domain-containing protein [Bacteroidales bacterium]|nr:DUF3857 and transglutaminase domain-containing protein [Bacteroidales bacterium]